MKRRPDLLKLTRDFLITEQLVCPGQGLVAAVSAGRDSCVMLHILYCLKQELEFSLAVAHFNHQLRLQSADEQLFVQELAKTYGLPFYGGSADVQAMAQGKNLEDTARRARYTFLRATAERIGAESIATAHHRQDQAETVLLHLLRGSGLEGLAAMAAGEDGIIRPLLRADPQQIEQYRVFHNLAFCQDESNQEIRFLRNRIRLSVLPQLLALNPQLLPILSATADICREDNALLVDLAKSALDDLWLKDVNAIAEGFFTLAPALQRRVVRLAFTRVSGEELSFAQTEAVRDLREEQSVSVVGGWLIYRRGALFIGRERKGLPVHQENISLTVDGAWHKLAAWGWEYKAEYASAYTGIKCIEEDFITLPVSLSRHIYFRTRRAGDVVPSKGNMGWRKLKDIFIKAKIPPYQRIAWPLLCCGQEVLWLPYLYKCSYGHESPQITVWARSLGMKINY